MQCKKCYQTIADIISPLQSRIKELESALTELVNLKQFAAEHTVKFTPRTFDTKDAEEEYKRRKPLAWQMARQSLHSQTSMKNSIKEQP